MNYAIELRASYEMRFQLLSGAARQLEARVVEALDGIAHIDRIGFRVKGSDSFIRKCTDENGNPKRAGAGAQKYVEPLEEVEDQIAGRVLVFFRGDLEIVESRIREWFAASVEFSRREPEANAAFGYESDHFVFVIDEHMKPEGWDAAGPMPTTFELQVRTLFMHAYAEPQHDLGYKSRNQLPPDVERQFAWIAASAWGADRTMNELYDQLSEADPGGNR